MQDLTLHFKHHATTGYLQSKPLILWKQCNIDQINEFCISKRRPIAVVMNNPITTYVKLQDSRPTYKRG